jgi:hypothetical protein
VVDVLLVVALEFNEEVIDPYDEFDFAGYVSV